MGTDLNQFLPLSPPSLHILIALAGEDLHGYAIMLEVARQTKDGYKLRPGTLYDNIQKLLGQKLIERTGRTDANDERRLYYRLTSLGRGVVAADISRLETVFRKAKSHLQPVSASKP